MEEYYFLFVLGFLWILFATFQDIRKREVANWLNFSLIAFALAYRAFYSLNTGNWEFFTFGLLGFALFFSLAHGFYYMRAFAGGDAKLLMGLGIIIPMESLMDLAFNSISFVFSLFFFGAIYGLVYSFFLVGRAWERFSREFKHNLGRSWLFVIIVLIISLIASVFEVLYGAIGFSVILLLVVYAYVRSLDEIMIVLKRGRDLQEGDWLEKSVRIKGKVIRKSVHGLSKAEIRSIKKANKRVWIKEGIPFVPAFLIAFLFMVYVYLVLEVSFYEFFSSLFL